VANAADPVNDDGQDANNAELDPEPAVHMLHDNTD
jgi:hypothetical protein